MWSLSHFFTGCRVSCVGGGWGREWLVRAAAERIAIEPTASRGTGSSQVAPPRPARKGQGSVGGDEPPLVAVFAGPGSMAPPQRCPLCRQTFFCGRGHVYSHKHQRQLKGALERLLPQVGTRGWGGQECGLWFQGPSWLLSCRWRPPAGPSAPPRWSAMSQSTIGAVGARAVAARCENT